MIKKTLSTAALLMLLGASVAHAQTASGTMVGADVKPGDWAYDAVQDLASKGLIKGYPPDGNFLGGRALTRYEMATIISRVLARMDDMAANGSSAAGMQTQLTETRQLVDQFKVELTVIGARLDTDEAALATLQGQVGDLQIGLGSAYDAIEEQSKRTDSLKKQVKADEATNYSANSKSKFTISGYIQFRADLAASTNAKRFPQGSAAVAGPYNGNYAQGGVPDGAQVRRARLKFAGAPTDNTTYAAQLDYSGAVTNAPTSVTLTPGANPTNLPNNANQQITLREAWGAYTFGNGTPGIYPTVTAGQFALPFGYILPASTASILTPERALAFSEGSTYGLFNGQDYDKGVKVSYGPSTVNLTYAAVNGAGRNNENIDSHLDNVVRLAYSSTAKQYTGGPSILSIGSSYYAGFVNRLRPTNTVASAGNPTLYPSPGSYPKPKKDLFGVDAQVTLKNGVFVDGEWVKGKYEARSYFASQNAVGISNDAYVKGNQVEGYYIWGGYTFNPSTAHALTLAGDYDVFQRSKSAQGSAFNTLANGAAATTSGNSSFDDVNFGGGALYNVDKATRVRLWYETPKEVAHLPGTPEPAKIGLYTVELQYKY